MALPSLIVFGSQTEWPSKQVLVQLRESLLNDPSLSTFLTAIKELPHLWEDLLKSNPSLKRVPGLESVNDILGWIDRGEFAWASEMPPNVLSTPFTIIIHIVQYFKFLKENKGYTTHADIIENVKYAGIQGFCAGFLSAIALACSKNEDDLGILGAVALRLAFCIGAFVDLEGAFASPPNETSLFAVRWKSGGTKDKILRLLEGFPEAYISAISHPACVTITVAKSSASLLAHQLSIQGLIVKPIRLEGRFHSHVHDDAVKAITKLSECNHDLQYPTCANLLVPVRRNSDGQVISGGSLLEIALKSVMTEVSNWNLTILAASSQLELVKAPRVIVAGLTDPIPSSITRDLGLRLIKLSGSNIIESTLTPEATTPLMMDSERRYPDHAIAIVGMACKFPGADSTDEFWDIISSATSTEQEVPSERFSTKNLRRSPAEKTKFWGNFIRDVDAFDHKFFKKSGREAVSADPQQRLLLQCAYEAMESSGYFGELSGTPEDDIGCYLGACSSDYNDNVASHPPTAFSSLGTLRAFLSGKISHYFGWSGPSMTFDTACSSSLVAINQACKAIQYGECSRAVAGGVSIFTNPNFYQNLTAGGFLSPTGPCKTFDAKADGYCRGEGVGLVVLRKLSEAIKGKDNILGVITGSAVNQNSNVCAITVPHSPSQVKLYNKVTSLSEIDPLDVSFVEAHGTGTPVGDPIEFESIRQVFGDARRKQKLYVGSVKGNIGHTEAASGVAAVIKAVLMLQQETIPAQANFTTLNSKIGSLEPDCMDIPTTNLPWKSEFRAVCINNYGASGSNAAMILCQAPKSTTRPREYLPRYPIFISAFSHASLVAYCSALQKRMSSVTSLADLAFGLSDKQNRLLPHVLTTTVSNMAELRKELTICASVQIPAQPKPLVLAFGGQTTDTITLCKDVYDSSTLLRSHLDRCDGILRAAGLKSLFPDIFRADPTEDTVSLHCMLFSLQYSCAKSWIDSGLRVDRVVGHSFGQLTALCVSGCLSLEDGLRLVSGRAALMQSRWGSEKGSMISLEADVDTALNLISDSKFEMACYNGPSSQVIVGDSSSIGKIEDLIAAKSIKSKKLNVTHGFHSIFTEPLLPALTELAATLVWKEPTIPLETCSDNQSWQHIEPRLIAEHTRTPVYFGQAVDRIARQLGPCTWLEAGSGTPIIGMVRRALDPSVKSEHNFQSMQLGTPDAAGSLADSTVSLWKLGYKVQFFPFHRCQKQEYEHVSLPPYQFEKTRHWLEFVDHAQVAPPLPAPTTVESEPSLLSLVKADGQDAEFLVDPRSKQYNLFVSGHAVLANPLLPAPLYVELVSSAALTVAGSPSFIPSVEDFEIQAPLGLDPTREIALALRGSKGEPHSWAFEVSSHTRGNEKDSSVQHATGKIVLGAMDEPSLRAEFARYESLVDFHRYEALVEDAEDSMLGPLVYKIFAKVVQYADYYKGVKSVSSKSQEIVGQVVMPSHDNDALSDTASDPLAIDNFVQVAGMQINSLKDCADNEVYIATKIDRIQPGLSFKEQGSTARSWMVYSNYRPLTDKEVINDIYVFDHASKTMVMLILGARFTKVNISSLTRVLSRANPGETPGLSHSSKNTPKSIGSSKPPVNSVKEDEPAAARAVSSSTSSSDSSDPGNSPPSTSSSAESTTSDDQILQLKALVAEHLETDLDISSDTCLADLGFDSLLGVELLGEIEKSFGIHVEMDEVTSESTFGDLSKLVLPTQASTPAVQADSTAKVPETQQPSSPTEITGSLRNSQRAFDEVRLTYDTFANETGFANFWSEVYPKQLRLVNAYVVEAFAKLGCPLASLEPGDKLPTIRCIPKHSSLMNQLYEILKKASLISSSPSGMVRTGVEIDETSSNMLFCDLIKAYPLHASEHSLLNITGSKLAECLNNSADPLQLLFRSKDNRDLLEHVYQKGPMYAAVTMLLGSFLDHALTEVQGTVHIMEIGGGTGGTTKYILDHLSKRNVNFTYTFTDISGSLVAAAKKTFAGRDYMEFKILDAEKTPPENLLDHYHIILSTNCIHATKNLTKTTTNIRKMLRKDGFLSVVEFTRNMFWFDLVFGLLDGWWSFEDGRTHVLADEGFWDRSLKDAGFKHVAWTSGDSLEANTLRIITGFQEEPLSKSNSESTSMETVMFKKVGETPLYADIYYPRSPEASHPKRPVALMIHGGGHVMLSRKDVRTKQTQLLLDNGLLPVSVDYRLCPEMNIIEGPMTDVCDALQWARYTLPNLELKCPGLQVDGQSIVVIGWSTGGTLAMTLAWLASQQGFNPPEAILAFYCPTDYEAACWKTSNYPEMSEPSAIPTYDLLEGVEEKPITGYKISPKHKSTGGWMSLEDPRSRIVLHMNWHGQALPVLLHGLPSRKTQGAGAETERWQSREQPSEEEIVSISPLAQIRLGSYRTPTFLVHGTRDDLIPWRQSQMTYDALTSKGVNAGINILDDAIHLFDLHRDPDGKGWLAVQEGYDFLFSCLRNRGDGREGGQLQSA